MLFLPDGVRWRPSLASGLTGSCASFFVLCLKCSTKTFEYPADMNLNCLSKVIFAELI